MNWLQRIERAEKKGKFTPVDVRLAESWATCAVGENRKRLPLAEQIRNPYREWGPTDRELIQTGYSFMYSVEKDQVADARSWYERIQQRVAELEPAFE